MYRRQGYGYGKISKLINVSKSTVATYCRRNAVKPITQSKDLKASERTISDNTLCKYCGSELLQSKRGQPKKFCSEICRHSWWKEHEQELNKKAYYLVTCKNCNKLFESYGNKNRKYCSHECYISDTFTQKRESIKDIGTIIMEFFNEINNLTSCKRATACNSYTGKVLSKKAMDKLIEKYSFLIYELKNKGMED